MEENQNIYKDIKDTSKEALNFLSSRDNMIKKKEAECDNLELTLINMKEVGMPTETEEKMLAEKEKELYNLEFDIESIMTEQQFMDKLMSDVNKILGNDVTTYGDSLNHLQGVKNDIERLQKEISDFEKEIAKTPDEFSYKDALRMKVISREEAIEDLKKLEKNINNKFSSFSSYEDNRSKLLDKAMNEKSSLEKKMEESKLKMDNAYKNFASIHKQKVDAKMQIQNAIDNTTELDFTGERFDVPRANPDRPTTEIENMQEELAQIDEQSNNDYTLYEEHINNVKFLQKQIEEQNSLIRSLNDDKKWLYNRIELKDREIKEKDEKIKSLELKLDTWKESYKEFDKLVTDLANYVGYKKPFINANGSQVIEENPLRNLIERLERITEYVQSPEYQREVAMQYGTIQEEKSTINGVLLGGLAIGTLALTTLINK